MLFSKIETDALTSKLMTCYIYIEFKIV